MFRSYQIDRNRNCSIHSAGQGATEFLIVLVVIAVVVLVAVRFFGSSVTEQYQNASQEIAALTNKSDAPLIVESSDGTAQTGTSNAAPETDEPEESAVYEKADPESDKDEVQKQVDILQRLQDEERPIQSIELPWYILFSIGAAFCLACLALVFRWWLIVRRKKLKRGKKTKKKQKSAEAEEGDSGQAMVEFVFVAITFLFTILGVIQLAMVLNAYSLVRYAAYNAARAGIVHNVDQERMEDAARISLLAVFPRHGRADHRRGITENYLAARELDTLLIDENGNPITYYGEPITRVSVINNNQLVPGAVITFDDPVDAARATITVQVVHQYELVIPLVNRMIFWVYTQYRDAGGYGGQTADFIAAETNRLRRDGDFQNIDYRIPLVSHYTMHLQSDYRYEG